MYVCSPGNPTGRVLTLDEWRALFERSDRYGFVIASDECYSEIYGDEDAAAARRARGRAPARPRRLPQPRRVHEPVEAIERAGAAVGRRGRRRGAAAAVPALSHVSWMRDEPRRAARQHRRLERRGARARESRRSTARSSTAVVPMLAAGACDVRRPDAGLLSLGRVRCRRWRRRRAFARELFAATHVTVLPGRYLGARGARREPGRGYVRIALVPGLDECVEAAARIVEFCR